MVDGVNHGEDSTSYKFEDVTDDHTIDAYFSINTYTITATAYGGTITPSGPVIVNYGSDTTFTFSPNMGYHMDSLVVDGTNHGADSTQYKFTSVTANHTIDACFSINTYTIIATAGSGGTIIPSGEINVTHGADTSFTIIPNSGYEIADVLVDDESFGPISYYEFLNVIEPHTIHAEFTLTALPGWSQKESIPHASDIKEGKYVKDGGAMTTVSTTDDDDVIYMFPGNKSWQFYKYEDSAYTTLESIPYGVKVTNPLKINKKKVGKGAALCFDGMNTVYATKGNNNPEFWAYRIADEVLPETTLPGNTWTAKAFVPVPKALKGGTSIRYCDGKVYLLAGGQKKTDTANFFVYDPTADTVGGEPWSALADLELGPKLKVWKDGACITELYGIIYAMKSNDKPNKFYAYDTATNVWTAMETLPTFDSLYGKLKKVYVKDGGAMTSGDDGAIYALKGGGYNLFYKYTPTVGWEVLDTMPRLDKKSVPKTGAALAYANNAVWLMKGNNRQEFWQYVPTAGPVTKPIPSTMTPVMVENNTHTKLFSFNVTPNPFTKFATIRYTIPVSGKVSLKLYNVTGRVVKTIHDGYLTVSTYTTNLSAKNLAKGVYFLRYENVTNRAELKLILQ